VYHDLIISIVEGTSYFYIRWPFLIISGSAYHH